MSAGLRVELDMDNKITTLRLCFGDVGATPLQLDEVETKWTGSQWNEQIALSIAKDVDEAIKPISDHRASESYRRKLVHNFIRGFYFETRDIPQPLLPEHPGSSFDEAQL